MGSVHGGKRQTHRGEDDVVKGGEVRVVAKDPCPIIGKGGASKV